MLSFMKILCVIFAAIFLAIGIFGKFLSADVVGVVLTMTAVMMDRNSKSHPSVAKLVASIGVIIIGVGLALINRPKKM